MKEERNHATTRRKIVEVERVAESTHIDTKHKTQKKRDPKSNNEEEGRGGRKEGNARQIRDGSKGAKTKEKRKEKNK